MTIKSISQAIATLRDIDDALKLQAEDLYVQFYAGKGPDLPTARLFRRNSEIMNDVEQVIKAARELRATTPSIDDSANAIKRQEAERKRDELEKKCKDLDQEVGSFSSAWMSANSKLHDALIENRSLTEQVKQLEKEQQCMKEQRERRMSRFEGILLEERRKPGEMREAFISACNVIQEMGARIRKLEAHAGHHQL